MSSHTMSSSFPSSFVSQEEFNLFHRIDRELYILLVIILSWDPIQSMKIMAFWLWLERVGFRNIVKKILSLPPVLINELANETVLCLNCITNDQLASSSENNDIPLMKTFVGNEISLHFIHQNRLTAAQNVAEILNRVCVRALKDIAQKSIERNMNQRQIIMSNPIHQSLSTPPEDRTMFVTFSKGYPVYEWEVREFFIRMFGDCIDSLHIQDVLPNEQPLFGRIVFRSATTIDLILNGLDKVKFTINGKHVWARKFIPKRGMSAVPPTTPQHFLPVSLGL